MPRLADKRIKTEGVKERVEKAKTRISPDLDIKEIQGLIQAVINELELTRGSDTIQVAIRLLKSMSLLQKQVEELAKEYLRVAAQVQGLRTQRSKILWILERETEIISVLTQVHFIDWDTFPGIQGMFDKAKRILVHYKKAGEIPEEDPFELEYNDIPNLSNQLSSSIGDPNSGVPFMHKCTDPEIFPIIFDGEEIEKEGGEKDGDKNENIEDPEDKTNS